MIVSTYLDKVQCPNGHRYSLRRKAASAGKTIRQACAICKRTFNTVAGPLPTGAKAGPTLEKHIEARLVKRVEELGGECRKVKWIGRNSAPDRIVMLPSCAVFDERGMTLEAGKTIWVELKAPGRAATFPKGAHEKAQHREHERMRKMGQRVEVVDSFERIEEILK